MTIEETLMDNTELLMVTRIRIALGEYDRAKICAIRANMGIAEWLGVALREKLERDEAQA